MNANHFHKIMTLCMMPKQNFMLSLRGLQQRLYRLLPLP